MPKRTVTCGECGASAEIPEGDWNTVQAPKVEVWERKHARETHQGDEISAVQVHPSPLLDK